MMQILGSKTKPEGAYNLNFSLAIHGEGERQAKPDKGVRSATTRLTTKMSIPASANPHHPLICTLHFLHFLGRKRLTIFLYYLGFIVISGCKSIYHSSFVHGEMFHEDS